MHQSCSLAHSHMTVVAQVVGICSGHQEGAGEVGARAFSPNTEILGAVPLVTELYKLLEGILTLGFY